MEESFCKNLIIKDMRQKKLKIFFKLFQFLYVYFDNIKNLLLYFKISIRDYFIIK